MSEIAANFLKEWMPVITFALAFWATLMGIRNANRIDKIAKLPKTPECAHKWRILDRVQIWDENDPSANKPKWVRATMTCDCCGEITQRQL